ncbi:acyl-CoA dehydratase activase [Methanopyrus sp. SNP6]|uniref:acyl-CoA dehydratase activase n=1 Tax=Methanopyrus sp. SNP6 TaxID=1937005 RepID=UPI0011E5A575|nr:acyl-CoA dehydratase activase [Methanopyrus sp. SNP6]
MRVLGVDAGSSNLKCAIVEDDSLEDYTVVESTGPVKEVLRRAMDELSADIDEFDVTAVTGYGREALSDEFDETVPELPAVALGASRLVEGARTVIDVGGQDTKVMKVKDGKVVDFQVNDKCAAGTGRFVENVCRRLGIEMSEVDEHVNCADDPVKINSMCAVFAETEVISLVNRGIDVERILLGILDSVAERVATMADKVSPEPEVVLVGGMTRCRVFTELLSDRLKMRINVPDEAHIAGALGAALWVLEK